MTHALSRSRGQAFQFTHEAGRDNARIRAKQGQTISGGDHGDFSSGHRCFIRDHKMHDLHSFAWGQVLDLVNDFARAHAP